MSLILLCRREREVYQQTIRPPKASKRKKGGSDDANKTSRLDTNFLWQSLNQGYRGKQLLLKATIIYKKGAVPPGEKNYFFKYSVGEVHKDMETAIIWFGNKYIVEDGKIIRNYQGAQSD